MESNGRVGLLCKAMFVFALLLHCLQAAPTTTAPPPATLAAAGSTSSPLATTDPALATTNAPLATTDAPIATTDAPIATTDAPITTTDVPVATGAPIATTSAPIATSTNAPVSTTNAPIATTNAPIATTNAPTATTNAPVPTTDAPSTTNAPPTTPQRPPPPATTQAPTTIVPPQTTSAPTVASTPTTTAQPLTTTLAPTTADIATSPSLIDGRWTNWGDWEPCSATCGPGSKHRMRTCTNPPPSNGGLKCTGNADQTFYCSLGKCPADGGWSVWSEWTECSAPCGEGVRKNRTRTCTNPAPGPGGKTCNGSASETAKCDVPLCPVDGDWSDYTQWSECTATCGGGDRYRERTCTNPPPTNGGKTCSGNGMESQACNTHECTVEPPTEGTASTATHHAPQAVGCEESERYKPWLVVGIVLLVVCIVLILVIVYLCAKSIRNRGEGSISKENKKKKEDRKKNGKEDEIALEETKPLNEENANA